MSGEQLPQPSPRSEYTFFPKPEEQDTLHRSDPLQMTEHIEKQPKILMQILHEMWRHRRDGDIHKLGEYLARGILNDQDARHYFALGMVFAVEIQKQPLKTFKKFLHHTSDLFIRGQRHIPLDELMDEEALQESENFERDILTLTKDFRLEYKFREYSLVDLKDYGDINDSIYNN